MRSDHHGHDGHDSLDALPAGKSISEIARLTSLSRNTIEKWLKMPQGAQPKYRRREMPTKLAPFAEALQGR